MPKSAKICKKKFTEEEWAELKRLASKGSKIYTKRKFLDYLDGYLAKERAKKSKPSDYIDINVVKTRLKLNERG